jgi:hypothetical protein
MSCGGLGLSLIALWLCLRVRMYSQPVWIKQRFVELEAAVEAQGQWWKKLNANVASIRGTLKRGQDESPESNGSTDGTFSMHKGETPEQWKTRMRMQLATGQLRPPR